jgi:Lrp/AsnC family transcriptional regulator, regulator for asnA, asnC and gidA
VSPDENGGPDLKVDDLDRQIIAQLQPDGRLAFSEVAQRLSVSEGTVRQRYHRLVDAGVLQVVAVADPFRIGFSTMAMIGINIDIDGERGIDSIANEIAAHADVSYAVMSTGSFDLIVEVITPNHAEFVRFLTEKLHPIPGVRRTETFMLLRVYKMNLGGWRMAQLGGPDGPSRSRKHQSVDQAKEKLHAP